MTNEILKKRKLKNRGKKGKGKGKKKAPVKKWKIFVKFPNNDDDIRYYFNFQ